MTFASNTFRTRSRPLLLALAAPFALVACGDDAVEGGVSGEPIAAIAAPEGTSVWILSFLC